MKNGENIAIHDKVIASTGGYIAEASGDSSSVITEEWVIGEALEAKDMSGSSAVDPSSNLCLIEIY